MFSISTLSCIVAPRMIVFAAGRSLADPMKDVVTAALAPPQSLAAFFGVAFLALAVGGSAGNYAGGWLFDVATATGLHPLPSATFALAGLLIAGGMLVYARVAAYHRL